MKKLLMSTLLWGLALTGAVTFSYLTSSGLESLELKFYDFRSQLAAGAPAKNEIAIIEINDESISRIGRWPWPRSKVADMITLLSTDAAKPAVIGLNVLFSEPEKNRDLDLADMLRQKYSELLAAKKIKESGKESEFLKAVDQAKRDTDNDAKLSRAIESAGNVVLPMYFATGEVLAKPKPEPEWLKRFSVPVAHGGGGELSVEGGDITMPLELLASSAAGVGHVNVFNDPDGAVRKEFLFIPYGTSIYPSFAAELVRNFLRLNSSEVVFNPASAAAFGKNSVPLDAESSLMVLFNESRSSFKYYSFYDVMERKIVPEAFKDKIVLIGLTAQGVGSLYVTPVSKSLPNVEFTANAVENILHGRYVQRPAWAFQAELGLILLAGLFVTFLLPRLKAGLGAVAAFLLLAGFIGSGVFLFVSQGFWIKTMYPAILLTAGYVLVFSMRFFTTEKKKELIEVSQIETNKMLGLSFQGQGMLDLAFEKFRLCPIDDNMKDTLYNLALDFERKRQFNKAVAVYEHISGVDPDFKDIKTKIDMLKKAADGAVFGGVGGKGGGDATMMVAGSSATPTLGRYEIKKELGKGAMGIVYLGEDPKIHRTVAIKTMRFEEGLEEKQMKELKDRFFREAQAAGNLQHPHIVKIYDAGEEQDIAYIAMELLKGDDLKKWTSKDSLLPVDKVISYIADAADALGYANKNGIVHRDIKPANIMLLEDGNIRVADFGIARITESSKTATGTVLGTPYYMSPEQIAGKKVDGRADIFSLGVTLFELLTGEKPWKGGESIGTLLFQITSDPYPDPLKIRPDLPPAVMAVIDKALKKNPEERYASAGLMSEDLKSILAGKPPVHASAPPQAPAPQTPAPAPAAQPAPAPRPAPVPQPAPAAAPKPAPKPAPAPAPKPAAAQQPAPKPQAQAPAAPAPKPGGIELAPRDGLTLSGRSQPAPAPAPKPAAKPSFKTGAEVTLGPTPAAEAPKPQPAPAPQPAAEPQQAPKPQPRPQQGGGDFEKTLPLIYPEDDK